MTTLGSSSTATYEETGGEWFAILFLDVETWKQDSSYVVSNSRGGQSFKNLVIEV